MSAFVVSAKHIITICAWAQNVGYTSNPLKLGRELAKLNCAAVNSRYGTDEKLSLSGFASKLLSERFVMASMRTDGDSASYAYALLDCLDYQCEEYSGPKLPGQKRLAELMTLAKAKATNGKPTANVWSI